MSKDIHSFIHKSNSWREFHELLKNESDFIKGKAFELFCICYLSTNIICRDLLKNVWHESECPDEIYIDKLGLLRPEIGVDIICEDNNNRFWTVQSKYRSNESENLPYAEVSTFFHVVNRPKTKNLLSNKLIMTSTYELSDRIREVDDDFNCLNYSSFDELCKSDFDDFRDHLNNKFIPKNNNRFTPMDHQNDAIRDICKDFKNNSRLQLIMACGTGKTLVALWVKEALNYEHVLVLIPSLNLAAQIIKEWFTHKKYRFDALCICADKSVTKRDEEYDEWVSSTSEVNIPVNNDINQIKIFLKNKSPKVVFCTYQSSNLVAEAMLDKKIRDFDITFCDEAHRCAGADSKKYSIILDENRIRSRKRLFLTATPKASEDELNKAAIKKEKIIHSMDDKSKFGKRSYVLTFHDALTKYADPLLCDYRIVICDVHKSEYKTYEKIIQREFGRTDDIKQIDAETLATHVALLKSIKQFNLKRIITFHNKCERAKHFSDTLPKVNEWQEKDKSKKTLICEYIDGEMSTYKRKEKLKILKSKTSEKTIVFSNARCLQEGVDINNLDGIAFVDPKQSFIEIIQAIGRVMRVSKETGKEYGTILIPVFIDENEDINQKINESNFKQVWRIGKALSKHDDYLSEQLKELRISLGKRKTISKGNKGLIVDKIIIPEKIDNQFAEDIHLLLAKKLTDDWYEKYGELLKNIDDNDGRFNVKRSHPTLGDWLHTQRTLQRNNELLQERFLLLDKLRSKGFEWNPDAELPEKYLNLLEEYLGKNGHLIIKSDDTKYRTPAVIIRNNYEKNPNSTKYGFVFQRLNELSDYWMYKPEIEVPLEKIRLLKLWCDEKNSVKPTENDISEGSPKTFDFKKKSKDLKDRQKFNLGQFANDLRRRYNDEIQIFPKKRLKDITDEEIEATEQIEGWCWNLNEGYARVYKKCIKLGYTINVNFKAPKGLDKEDFRNVGFWISRMRNDAIHKNYDSDYEMDIKDIMIIESLPGWSYEPAHDQFMKRFEQYASYTKNLSNKKIPRNLVINNNFPIGEWSRRIQRNVKAGIPLSKNALYDAFYKKLLKDNGFIF